MTTDNKSSATSGQATQKTSKPVQAMKTPKTSQSKPVQAAVMQKPTLQAQTNFSGISATIKQPVVNNPYAQKMQPLDLPKSAPAVAATAAAPTQDETPKTGAKAPAVPEEKEEDLGALDMIQRYLRMNGIGPDSTIGNLVEDVRVDDDGGSHFKLLNGAELFMGNVHNPATGTAEYIGVYKGTFDENTAKAIVTAAKDKGWESINLHGRPHKKDMLFIEAMKAGIEVNPESYKPDPKKLQKWLDQGLLTQEDLAPKQAEGPAGTTENKDDAPEAPKAETEAKPEATTPGMQMSQKWTESGEEFQKNFNVDLPIPAAPKGMPITSPKAEQQANFMSKIEKDITKTQKDIDTRQANTRTEALPKGRVQENWAEKKQHMQRTLNNVDKRLKNNETMPQAQFTKVRDHYKSGNYKMAADVSGLKVTMKDQGMKVQTPKAKAPEKPVQTAQKPQKMTL